MEVFRTSRHISRTTCLCDDVIQNVTINYISVLFSNPSFSPFLLIASDNWAATSQNLHVEMTELLLPDQELIESLENFTSTNLCTGVSPKNGIDKKL